MGMESRDRNACPSLLSHTLAKALPCQRADGDIMVWPRFAARCLGGGSSLVRALMGDEVEMLAAETVIQVVREKLDTAGVLWAA